MRQVENHFDADPRTRSELCVPLKVKERVICVINAESIELHAFTARLGVTQLDENTPNLETLIARADQVMYIAKHKGRNRVAIST